MLRFKFDSYSINKKKRGKSVIYMHFENYYNQSNKMRVKEYSENESLL